MDTPISLNTTPQSDDPISLDTLTSQAIPPSTDVAAQRAFKAHFGVGDVLQKDQPTIFQNIASGQEGELRKEAANQIDANNSAERQTQITNLVSSGQLSINHMDKMVPPFPLEDPDLVFEKHFTDKAVKYLDVAGLNMGGTFVKKAMEEIPEQYEREKQVGATIAAKREIVLTTSQNLTDEVEHQPTGSWLVDKIKPLASLGFYDEWKLRGLVPGVSFFAGGGLGNNLQAERARLMSLPVEDFKIQFKSIVDKLRQDNPEAALRFTNAMLGQTSSERLVANVLLPFNIATFPGVGTLTNKVISWVSLTNATRKGAQDIVNGLAQVAKPTETSILNSAGDAAAAAPKQMTTELAENLSGQADPVARSSKAFVSAMQDDKLAMNADPGTRSGQEIVNRLNADYDTTVDTFTKVIGEDLSRVDRLPEVTRVESAMKAVYDVMKDGWTGAKSMIHNIKSDYDPFTNIHYGEMVMGREDGTLFSSPSEAFLSMRDYGINTEMPKGYLENLENNIKELKAHQEATRGRLDEMEGNGDAVGLVAFSTRERYLTKLEDEFNYISTRGPDGYAIKQQGAGFYVSLNRPLPETSNIARDFIPETNENAAFNAIKSETNKWRTPEETLSRLENEERKKATHGPSVLLNYTSDDVHSITAVSGKEWKDLERAIDFSRTMRDPEAQMGYFFKGIGELEDFYQMAFQRLPSDREVRAYFAFTRNVARDLGFRKLLVGRNMLRLGTEEHRFSVLDASGKKVYSPYIRGIQQKDFPGGRDAIYIAGVGEGEGKVRSSVNIEREEEGLKGKNMSTSERKYWEDLVDKGQAKVIRIFDPETFPLAKFDNIGNESLIRYMIVRNLETKPLDIDSLIPRRGGGHFVYDYPLSLRQAKVRYDPATDLNNYFGDVHVMHGTNNKLLRNVGDHLETFQKLMFKDKNEAAAEAFASNTLRIPFDKLKGWFNPSKDTLTGEIHEPFLDKEMPFHVTKQDVRIADIDNRLSMRYYNPETDTTNFRDVTRAGSDARANAVEFTGARDAHEVMAVSDKGTKGNPIYNYEPSKLVDPVGTMHRASNRVIDQFFMDDMKLHSMEHWIARATPFLEGGDIQDFRHAVPYWFAKGVLKKDADKFIKAALEDERFKIRQFVGIPSETTKWMQSASQQMADSVYGKFGPRAGLIADAALPYAKDPVRFVRSMTYHMKMGLFSPQQLFTQLTTGLNVMAIAGPRFVAKTGYAMLFHNWSRVNASEEILTHLDGLGRHFGWRPGELMEARNMLINKFGFQNIGGEYAFKDNPLSYKFVKSGATMLLDAGETPFRFGAQNVRIAAFYTAYKEMRDGGGGVYKWAGHQNKLSREEEAQLLSRAALLDHNMSRASNSPLQSGVTAPATQFLAYSLRLMELMTGKRLTVAEKGRLFGISALFYGVPIGGIGLYGFPLADYIKEKAADGDLPIPGMHIPIPGGGYVLGDSHMMSLFMEGLPAYLTWMVTGKWYNYSKWGDKGVDIFDLNGDKTVWNIMLGASGGTIQNAWQASSGLRMWMTQVFTGNEFKMTADALLAPLKEVQTLSMLARLQVAINTSNWVTKNGTVQETGIGVWDAIFRSVSGLTNTRIPDATASSKAVTAQEEVFKWGQSHFNNEMNLWAQAAVNGDDSTAQSHYTNAQAYVKASNFPAEAQGELVSNFLRSERALIERIPERYYTKRVPENKSATRADAMAKWLKQVGRD